jgi:hypothetical protein
MDFQLTTGAARRTLGAALLLGFLADLLLRVRPWGVGTAVWALTFATFAIVLGGRSQARQRIGPVAAAAAFALVFAWRASPVLLGLSIAAIFACLAMALLERPARRGLVPYGLGALTTLVAAGLGAIPALPVAARRAPGAHATWRPVRVAATGFVLAVPLLLVFGGLFANADPLFARYAQDFAREIDDLIARVDTILLAAWLSAGILVVLGLMRLGPGAELPGTRRGSDEVLVALGLVNLLFLAFLAVQARALLGGREFVETTIGLSYAEYARRGFFQLVACAAIALPALLAADWAMPPGAPRRRRFVFLAAVLTVMVLAVLVSAASRMNLYVDVYGLTELRLYTSAFMAWLAIAGLLFALTVLRGGRQRFAFTSLAAAAALLGGLVVVNPDATIVRFNVERVETAGFDALYATSLSADSVPALIDGLPRLDQAGRCFVSKRLVGRWGSEDAPDWRTWSWSRGRARSLVLERRAELGRACRSQRASNRQA